MNYFVISPNVWNNGDIKSHIDFMSRSHVVCMGWDKNRKNGRTFSNKIQTGDCVIVAQRKNWKWKVFFAGIVDGPARYGDECGEHYTMCRDIRAFVDLHDCDVVEYNEGMTGYARKNPGALFQLHEENPADAKFISGIYKLLSNADNSLFFTIKEISNWRVNGRIAIPSLQRGLVWNPNQVEILWDSILRGFPIGSFVFSTADKTSNQRTSDTHDDAEFFLLDGQQRASAISLAFENGGSSVNARLWVDLMPKTPPTRHFMVKATTKAHPWGYKNNDNCDILPVKEIRDAIGMFTQKRPSEIKNIDVSEFDLMKTWPTEAGCPIPLSTVLTLFDFYGYDFNQFKICIHEWLHSAKNISGKYPNPEGAARLDAEIQKWHFALWGLSKYRVHASVLPQRMIEKEDGDTPVEGVSNLESLFTRLNTMGTKISPYDLRYSAIKAYWGGIKKENDHIAQTIMPGANLAIFAFRLALTIAAQEEKKGGSTVKLADVPTIARIRKLGIGEDLSQVETRARFIILNELYAGRLKQIVNDIEIALDVYKRDDNNLEGLPPFLRTSIVSESPDVYLFLMILAYRKVLSRFSKEAMCALTTYIHWMSLDSKKNIVDIVYEHLQNCGFDEGALRKAVTSQIGLKLCPLVKLEFEVDDTGTLSSCWSKPKHADFYSRLKDNKELLIFSEREYFNRNFKYDPAQIDLNAGHNKPWDYDHIIPKEWSWNKKTGDFRQGCKYWTWTIGNYAAIPFSINRSKSNKAEWNEYLEHSADLLVEPIVSTISKDRFLRDQAQARLFFDVTSKRFGKIYSRWRDYAIKALALPENMTIDETVNDPET